MIRSVPTPPPGPRRLELQHERLSRKLPQIRVRRAHAGRGVPEFEHLAVGHARQACAEIVNVEIGFQRKPGQVTVLRRHGSQAAGPGVYVRTPGL
jgi:hypothetical protein